MQKPESLFAFAGLASELTEQLRLLLEPTKASKLAGDYRTGKRISMRKVVAYVASHFRKDKIWLRRTRPDKRQYQVSDRAVHLTACFWHIFFLHWTAVKITTAGSVTEVVD